MKRFNSEWWSVQIPTEWSVEQDEICTSISPKRGSGTLQVSAAHNNNGPATDEDLRYFMTEYIDDDAPIKPVKRGNFTGFYLHSSMKDTYQRRWWLRCNNIVLLATYTCQLDDEKKEDSAVNSILNTLART